MLPNHTYTNNFRLVKIIARKPPELEYFGKYKDCELYHSTFNSKLLVFLSPLDKKYHDYENNEESSDAIEDFKVIIDIYLTIT